MEPNVCGRQRLEDLERFHDRHRTRRRGYHRRVTTAQGQRATGTPRRGLSGMTPSGRAIVPASWALYDFANTIFSFAVVSSAIGLYLVSDRQFGERDGNACWPIAVVVSVGINALVSPILGAFSDRGDRADAVPPVLHGAVHRRRRSSSPTSPVALGVFLFIVANFAYQAALIYYDATLKVVSYPATRGKLSGIGTGIGYFGTVFVGLLIAILVVPVEDRFKLTAVLFARLRDPDLRVRAGAARSRARRRVTAAEVRDSFGQLKRSIAHARAVPGLGRFLLGRFFYSDAVNTVIVVMSVVTVKVFGLTENQSVYVLLSLTLVAIAMSFVWGWLVDRIGPKRTLDRRPRLVGGRPAHRRCRDGPR